MAEDNTATSMSAQCVAKQLSDSSKGRLNYNNRWCKSDLKESIADDSLKQVLHAFLRTETNAKSEEKELPTVTGNERKHAVVTSDRRSRPSSHCKQPEATAERGSRRQATCETSKIEQDTLQRSSWDRPAPVYTPFELRAESTYQHYSRLAAEESCQQRQDVLLERKKQLLERRCEVAEWCQHEARLQCQRRDQARRRELSEQDTFRSKLLKEAEADVERRIQADKRKEMEVRHATQLLEATKKKHFDVLLKDMEGAVQDHNASLRGLLARCSAHPCMLPLQEAGQEAGQRLHGQLDQARTSYDENKHQAMTREVVGFAQFVKGFEEQLTQLAQALEAEAQQRHVEEERAKKAKEQELQEKKNEPAKQAGKDAQQLRVPVTPASSVVSAATTQSCMAALGQAQATYLRLQERKKEAEKRVQPLAAAVDKKVKTYRFQLQKVMNTAVNSISTFSLQHLRERVRQLVGVLAGHSVEAMGARASTQSHPLATEFCLNYLAKKFVGQGEKTVSCQSEAAFPIAAVVLGVWSRHPDLGDFLLAHFHSICPILVPLRVPPPPKTTPTEYRRLMGYSLTSTGEFESDLTYLKRMSGVVRLYAALLQSPRQVWGKDNPLALANGWQWLSLLLNSAPLPGITATVICDFLEVAGHALWKEYKSQFAKLLSVLTNHYFPQIEAVTSPNTEQEGPTVRLRQFLQKCLSSGSVPEPKGVLPAAVWRS